MTPIAIFIIIIGTYCFANVLLNCLHFNKTDRAEAPKDETLVSIVIPARDEEKNIGKLLTSVLEQSYRNIEVLVIDDQSSDSTARIIKEYEQTDERVHYLATVPSIRKAVSGKTNALIQAMDHVNGEYIFTTDADCVMKKDCILKSLSIAQKLGCGMLIGMPEAVADDYITASATSMIMFGYIFTPHWLTIFPSGMGPYIFMYKGAYERTGGYDAVKNEIAEDHAISRLFIEKKEKLCYINASSLVRCKVFDCVEDAYYGLERSQAAMCKPGIMFVVCVLIVLCLMTVLVLSPLIALLYAVFGSDIAVKYCLAGGTVLFAAGWFIACKTTKWRTGVALTYPVSIAQSVIIALGALHKRIARKQIFWKGREVKFK